MYFPSDPSQRSNATPDRNEWRRAQRSIIFNQVLLLAGEIGLATSNIRCSLGSLEFVRDENDDLGQLPTYTVVDAKHLLSKNPPGGKGIRW